MMRALPAVPLSARGFLITTECPKKPRDEASPEGRRARNAGMLPGTRFQASLTVKTSFCFFFFESFSLSDTTQLCVYISSALEDSRWIAQISY
ncbi:hypothetical protein CDAR_230711 [Caerostris darwini]|uniref:Uncharacterized protein n=1 Tax=Caerostris darwini TaxID=1538125 RepID=A0AAV4S2W8_9ARAC|nr:hypothetical protein CDAR_230711 [Caerostris darwini]